MLVVFPICFLYIHFRPNELKLVLSERNKNNYMGFLFVQCTLIPKSAEDREQV